MRRGRAAPPAPLPTSPASCRRHACGVIRIVGRVTFGALTRPHRGHGHASPQIASASARSVLPRLTYGFTQGSSVKRSIQWIDRRDERHQAHLVAGNREFPRPVMGARAGLHPDQAGLQAREEGQHLAATQLPAQHGRAVGAHAVRQAIAGPSTIADLPHPGKRSSPDRGRWWQACPWMAPFGGLFDNTHRGTSRCRKREPSTPSVAATGELRARQGAQAFTLKPRCRAKACSFGLTTTSRETGSWCWISARALSSSTSPGTPPKARKQLSMPSNQCSWRSPRQARTCNLRK